MQCRLNVTLPVVSVQKPKRLNLSPCSQKKWNKYIYQCHHRVIETDKYKYIIIRNDVFLGILHGRFSLYRSLSEPWRSQVSWRSCGLQAQANLQWRSVSVLKLFLSQEVSMCGMLLYAYLVDTDVNMHKQNMKLKQINERVINICLVVDMCLFFICCYRWNHSPQSWMIRICYHNKIPLVMIRNYLLMWNITHLFSQSLKVLRLGTSLCFVFCFCFLWNRTHLKVLQIYKSKTFKGAKLTWHGRKEQIAVTFCPIALPWVERKDFEIEHWPLGNCLWNKNKIQSSHWSLWFLMFHKMFQNHQLKTNEIKYSDYNCMADTDLHSLFHTWKMLQSWKGNWRKLHFPVGRKRFG